MMHTRNLPNVRHPERGRDFHVPAKPVAAMSPETARAIEDAMIAVMGGKAVVAKKAYGSEASNVANAKQRERYKIERVERQDRLVAGLVEHGPSSAVEIADRIGMSASSVHSWMSDAIIAGRVTSERINRGGRLVKFYSAINFE